MAKSHHPDIVFLDNHMPGGNAIDIVKPLRMALPRAVILIETNSSEQEVIELAMTDGASGFVVKPFNTQSVLSTIAQASREFVLANPAAPRY